MRSRANHLGRRRGLSSERLERRVLLSAGPIGTEFGVNTFIVGTQNAPSIAMDGDGDSVAVWESANQDGDSYGIYAQRYNAAGQALPRAPGAAAGQGAGEFRVNGVTALAQRFPSVAVDAGGDFVVAWQSLAQDGSNPVSYGVYAQRFDSAGNPQGELPVNVTTAGDQSHPAVAMDAAGDTVIVWEGNGPGDADGVFARRYDAAGRPEGTEFRVNTATPLNQFRPSVAMDASGDFVVAWQGSDGTSFDVLAQRYDATGAPQGTEFRANSFTTGLQQLPAVAMDPAGDFVIAWESQGQDAPNTTGVYAKRYTVAGQEQAPPAGVTLGQGNEFRVNATTAGSQGAPSAACDGSGNFVIGWTGNGAGDTAGVFARQYSAAGAALADETLLNTTVTGGQSAGSVRMDGDGDFVGAWVSADGGGNGIWAQRFDETTDLAGPLVGTVTSSGAVVSPGATIVQNVPQFTVVLSEALDTAGGASGAHSVTNPANWGLAFEGNDVSSRITSVTFGLNPATNRYEANLTVSPQLSLDGLYQLRAKEAIRDIGGNALDGNFDDQSGGDFTLPFTIRQPVRLGGMLPVNTMTAGTQRKEDVAIDAAGDFVVTWHSRVDIGIGYDVYARRYSAAGVPQAGDFLVNTTTTSDQSYPSVAMDAAGDFVVVWQGRGQDNPDLGYGIYARRYSGAGVALSGEILVNVTTAKSQMDPSVAMDAAGDFVVAWDSLGQDAPGGYGVYARQFDPSGTPQSGEIPVNTTITGNQAVPDVAIDTLGDFVVSWESYGQDGSGYGIYARRFSAAGKPLSGELPVNTTTVGQQYVSAVACDAGGNFVVTWQEHQTGGFTTPHARRFNAAGLPLSGELLVDPSITEFDDPVVAMDSDGNFVISYGASALDNDNYGSGVYARRYNAAGVPQTARFLVNPATSSLSEFLPAVAMNAAGDFAVSWTGQAVGISDIYAQRYGVNEPPQSLGIAAVNVVENAPPTVIDLTTHFTDSTDASSALSYALVGDTNSALFGSTPIDAAGHLTLNYAADQSGQATLTVRATDTGGLIVETSFTVTVKPVPVLTAITVGDGSAQRSQVKSLTLTFDRTVTLAAGAVALQLLNTGGSGANDNSPPTDASSALDVPTTPDGGMTWIYTFAAPSAFVQKTSGGASTGSLVDGIYTLSVDPTKVTANGVAMAAAASLTFHRLFGDINGNKTVNTQDYGLFRLAFGKTSGQAGFDPAFDFDNNGAINTADYGQFRSRFGKAFTY